MDRRIISANYEIGHINLLTVLSQWCFNEELAATWPRIVHSGKQNSIDTIVVNVGMEPHTGGTNCIFRLSADGNDILVLHEEMAGFSELFEGLDDVSEVPDSVFKSIPFDFNMSAEELADELYNQLFSPDGPTLGA